MSAPVIMFASGKGGTGKSTVAALLGAEFARRDKRVLLVEVNTGLRSLDIVCGVYGKTVYDIGDVLAGRCMPEKAVVESTVYKNLYVVCAPYEDGFIDTELFCIFVARMRLVFDLILLDTASGMGSAFVASHAAATAALITVTPDAVAVRDGRIVVDALMEGGRTLPIRLLLNRVPAVLDGCGVIDLDECIDTVGAQLIGVLPQCTDILRAYATGIPLPEGSLARRALSAVALRITGHEVPLLIV